MLVEKRYTGNNFERRAHQTLDCEGTGGWQDGFFLVRVEIDYHPEMGDITVIIANNLDQDSTDESIGFGDLTFEYDYDPTVQVATHGQIEYGSIQLNHDW
jgi:hypothetical protein